MKKNFLKIFITCFILIPCLFFLYACNAPVALQYSLTKKQYATVFSQVSNSLNLSEQNKKSNAKSRMLLSTKSATTQAPVISGIENLPTVLELGEEYEVYNVYVSDRDSKATDIVLSWQIVGKQVGSKPEWVERHDDGRYYFDLQVVDEYTITLTATDESNNSASSSFVVNVQDTQKPTIELNSDYPKNAYCEYLTSQIILEERANDGETDDSGNVTNWEENKFPSINLPGFVAKDKYEDKNFASIGANGYLKITTPSNEEFVIDGNGSTADENTINLIMNPYNETNYFSFTPTQRGHYIATYSATDYNGNTTDKPEVIDIYVGDTESPIIYLTDALVEKVEKVYILNYKNELVINQNARIINQPNYDTQDLYVEDNYGFKTQKDTIDGNEYEFVPVSITVTNEDNTVITPIENENGIVKYNFNALGTYTVLFAVTDASGNSSTVARNFVVEEDTEKPVIHLTNNLITKLNKTYVVGEDDEIVINPIARIINQADYNSQDIYVEDNCGFNVVIGTDYEYVVIQIAITNEDGEELALQNVEDSENIKFKFELAGSYTITFRVTDFCGNECVLTHTIVVENKTEPDTPPEPTEPENPTEPINPENPTEPETPTNPENPTDPEENAETSNIASIFEYASLIMQNPDYKETNQAIAYYIRPNSNNNQITIKQRLNFDGTYVSGSFILSDNINYQETVVFSINYNFNTNTLESYEINDELISNGKTSYQSCTLKSGKFTNFKSDFSQNAQDDVAKTQLAIHNACVKEQQNIVVLKDYNFNKEYNQAMFKVI